MLGIYKGVKLIVVTQSFTCGKTQAFSSPSSDQRFSEYSFLFADAKSWSGLSIHVEVQESKAEIPSSPTSPGTLGLSSLEANVRDI